MGRHLPPPPPREDERVTDPHIYPHARISTQLRARPRAQRCPPPALQGNRDDREPRGVRRPEDPVPREQLHRRSGGPFTPGPTAMPLHREELHARPRPRRAARRVDHPRRQR